MEKMMGRELSCIEKDGRGIVLSGKMMRGEMPGREIVQIHMYHMSSINHHRDVCCFQFGLNPGFSDL